MGSWNGTCGVTQLPILSGDELVAFLLTQTNPSTDGGDNYTGGFCYPADLWAPRSIQIYGRYNDYGAMEGVDEQGWHLQFILAQLREDVQELELGANQYHDIEVKKDKLNWELVMEAIHEARLEVKGSAYCYDRNRVARRVVEICLDLKIPVPKHIEVGHFDEPRRTALVGWMMVHRFVFDAMVEKGIHDWTDFTVDMARTDGRAFYERLLGKSQAATAMEATSPDVAQLQWELLRMGTMLGESDRRNAFSAFFSLSEGGFSHYSVEKGVRNYGRDLLLGWAAEGRPLDDPTVTELIDEMAKFLVFNATFSMMRKHYSPQCGAGSQSANWGLYENVMDAARAYIERQKAEEEEWNREDEDDVEAAQDDNDT